MAQTTQYNLKIEVKGKEGIKDLQSQSQSFEKTLGGIGKAFAAAFAVDKLIQFSSMTVMEYGKQEQALLRFNKSISGLGSSTDQIRKTFLDLSNELEGFGSGVDDLDVLNLSAQFISLGRSSQEVEKLLRVATDLSAVTGDDLTTSVNLLTKADEGSIKALKIKIPAMKELTIEQLESGKAIDLVAEKTRDYAKEIGEGTLGQIQKFDNSIEDLNKHLGEMISNLTTPIASFF